MDDYHKLSPEMQELWDEDIKRVKEELEKEKLTMDDNKCDECGVISIARGSRWSPYVQYLLQMDKLISEDSDEKLNKIRMLNQGTFQLMDEYAKITSLSKNELDNMLDRLNTIPRCNSFSMEYKTEMLVTTTDQITSLKSQLKHCNNYLERQNIERRLNRLYKERR